MGKKQKKKQKGRAAAAAELTREEAREEVRVLLCKHNRSNLAGPWWITVWCYLATSLAQHYQAASQH